MNRLDLLAVGVVAPGLPTWEDLRGVLTGVRPYLQAPIPGLSPAGLPPNERRRATLGTRITLAAGTQALAGLDLDPSILTTVVTASESDLHIIDTLCTDIFSRRTPVSPTLFHNSVHNAVAGYWSIAQACLQPTTSISAWDGSLAAGLLECVAQLAYPGAAKPVLLLALDLPGPATIDPHRHLEGPFACALVLAPHPWGGGRSLHPGVSLRVSLAGHDPEDRLPQGVDMAIETLRAHNPAARVLPLLWRIATGEPGPVHLPYLEDLDLIVHLE